METRQIEVQPGRQVALPADVCQALHIQEGDALTLEVVGGEIRLRSQRDTIRHIQEIVRRHVPEGVSLADELIAERREEARRELEP